VVVLLPESGDRYLSKMFDDNWMRENGFLGSDRSQHSVADVLSTHPRMTLITAEPNTRLLEMVAMMKQHDISQIPIVDKEGKPLGIVTEVDLLSHLAHADHVHDPQETIETIVNPNLVTVTPQDSVSSVMSAFERGRVIGVVEGQHLVGMITKIDLIDYLTRQIG
jgi:cystathionine beta-synthase